MITALVYDSADDDIAEQLTTAVSVGARYFYSVEDTGGSWYVMLASDKPLVDVQQAWDTMVREDEEDRVR